MPTHKKMIKLLVLAGEASHDEEHTEFSVADLARDVGCTYSRAREVVNELIEEGYVIKVKRGEYAPTAKFEIVELPETELTNA